MSFEPYIGKHGIDDLRFFFATPEAVAWYEPLKPYTLLEYEWVVKELLWKLEHKSQYVIDAGCHHGNYSLVLTHADSVISLLAIDCVSSFCDITTTNLTLNEREDKAEFGSHWMVARKKLDRGNGAKDLLSYGFGGKPTIYKMDIEGAEFELMPDEIDDLPSVHTWIVEIHPHAGDPDTIAQAFKDRGFELLKVDRERMVVRPYEIGERWFTHATLIARKG